MESKAVLLDYRASDEIARSLMAIGLKVIRTCLCDKLPLPVNGHPDLMYHKISDEFACIAPNCFAYLINEFAKNKKLLKGKVFVKGKSSLGEIYPEDISYNILRIGNFAFGKISSIDICLRRALEDEGVELIDIKQGYAKCSVAVTSKNSAITSDIGILKVLEKRGISVLFLEPGGIDLPGYDYGFIGGASGLINDKFLLTGKFARVGCNEKIESFVKDNGSRLIFLSDRKIIDLGSVIEV